MAKRPARTGQSSAEVLQTLNWLRRNEFKPVPLRPQSKAALTRDYVSPDYRPPSDELWQVNDYGVGCVTGPAQKGPLDIDLDCDEAVFFAAIFLPDTAAVFGRPSKLRSHYLYRTDATTFDKQTFIDPVSMQTIVEIRGDGGHQTVFPGSIHEGTGEQVTWDRGAEPILTTVKADALTLAVRKIALATLIVRYAWADGYHNEPTKHLAGVFYHLGWSLPEAEQMIQALMQFSSDTDKTRLPTVRNTYKRAEAGRKVSGSGVLRKQIKNDVVVDRVLEWAGSPTVNLINEYNERYAVVTLNGKFRVVDLTTLNDNPAFMGKEDFLNWTATDYTQVDDKPVSKGRLWLGNPRRRTYSGIDFLPGEEDTAVLNLWAGWGVEPSTEDSCQAWLDLLFDVIAGGDGELGNWLLHWFANIVREPQNKALTAPVIIGRQGVGKSLLISYFGAILGQGYVVVTNERHLVGNFNAHMRRALLVHSEEAMWGGDKKHRGIIKDFITSDRMNLELKGVDTFRVRNYARLALTSNDQHAAPAEIGDRRFTVVAMGDRTLPEKLCKAVLHEMNNGGPARLFQHLFDMEYDPIIPRINLKNEALGDSQNLNMSPTEEWWFNVLDDGQLLPDYLAWASVRDPDGGIFDWPCAFSSQALYFYMKQTLRNRGVRMIPSQVQFGMELKKLTRTEFIHAQKTYDNPLIETAPPEVNQLNGKMRSIINMPTLKQCREAFEQYKGSKITWSRADDQPAKEKEPHERY